MLRFFLGLLLLITTKLNAEAALQETPNCIVDNAGFWKKILTVYGKDDLVFHDSRTFEIYQTIRLSEDTSPKERSNHIRQTLFLLSKELDEETMSNVRVQSGIKEKFQEGKEKSKVLLPIIKNIFKEEGVPDLIAYLPHVESSYNTNARSKVGARGMWQIMPGTARLYGVKNLKRLHEPEYSTKIAAKILLDNYRRLDDWNLAINAYHSGLGNLLRGKEVAGSSDICKIFEEYKGRSFRFASRNYLGQFYAVLEILNKTKSTEDQNLSENENPPSQEPKDKQTDSVKPKQESKSNKSKEKLSKKKDIKPTKTKLTKKTLKGKKDKIATKLPNKQKKPIRNKTKKLEKTKTSNEKSQQVIVIDLVSPGSRKQGNFDDYN